MLHQAATPRANAEVCLAVALLVGLAFLSRAGTPDIAFCIAVHTINVTLSSQRMLSTRYRVFPVMLGPVWTLAPSNVLPAPVLLLAVAEILLWVMYIGLSGAGLLRAMGRGALTL